MHLSISYDLVRTAVLFLLDLLNRLAMPEFKKIKAKEFLLSILGDKSAIHFSNKVVNFSYREEDGVFLLRFKVDFFNQIFVVLNKHILLISTIINVYFVAVANMVCIMEKYVTQITNLAPDFTKMLAEMKTIGAEQKVDETVASDNVGNDKKSTT